MAVLNQPSPGEYQATNISASTGAFTLKGGQYSCDYIATWNSGSVTLEKLALDGTTFVAVAVAWSANGSSLLDLPEGTYKLVFGGSPSAVYVNICRIRGARP